MLSTKDKRDIIEDELKVFLNSISFLSNAKDLGCLGETHKDTLGTTIRLIEIRFPKLLNYDYYIHKCFTKQEIETIAANIGGYITDALMSYCIDDFEAPSNLILTHKDVAKSAKRLATGIPKFIHKLEREL